jgi:hypothetical protein
MFLPFVAAHPGPLLVVKRFPLRSNAAQSSFAAIPVSLPHFHPKCQFASFSTRGLLGEITEYRNITACAEKAVRLYRRFRSTSTLLPSRVS